MKNKQYTSDASVLSPLPGRVDAFLARLLSDGEYADTEGNYRPGKSVCRTAKRQRKRRRRNVQRKPPVPSTVAAD
jgi:hypothetical protein